MRVSLIVAVYKDVESLSLIINSLKRQTYKNFEVIIAEDGENTQMREYIATVSGLDIKHTTHEDLGIRKARSVNNAILASCGEYLIFIDGDCIPYTTFIEGHVTLSERGKILTGRRINVGELISGKIRQKSLKGYKIEKNYFKYFRAMKKGDGSHIEQGFWLNPKSWIYRTFFQNRKKSNTNLLGCNYSCFREDMIAIGGYDESYGETALADDTDLQWRFEAYGLQMKSCKFTANIFHLYHTRSYRNIGDVEELKSMLQKKQMKQFYATLGVASHANTVA